MFFWLSKVLWTFADAANFLLMLMIVGVALLWTGAHRTGRIILSAVLAILLLISIAPLGGYMMAFLEGRFPVVEEPVGVDGVVLLGGALDAASYYESPGTGYTSSIGRVVEAARLAKRNPSARLIVAGGPNSDRDAARQRLRVGC